MKIIGITGGVGSGKSQILSYIREHYSCRIYLADEVAHIVKEKGECCYQPLVDLLGKQILDEDGEIDKKKMAAVIFSDDTILQKVNEIIHPKVKEYLLARINEAYQEKETELFFIEAALLIEAGYEDILDELWYVYAQQEVRSLRLQQSRGYSVEKISQIMESQLPEEIFFAKCDFVIDNSGDLEDSYRQVRERLKEFTVEKGEINRNEIV